MRESRTLKGKLTFSTPGFTLFEVLLVIGLLALLGVLSVPFYQTFHVQSQLDTASTEALQAVRTAQLNSMTGQNDIEHGVHFEAGQFIVFEGPAYVPGSPNNFATTISPALSLTTSFGPDIIFAQRTGIPDQTGTITISSSNKSHTLSINALGTVDQTN